MEAPHQPRLLDQVRERCRVKHYSLRTEQAYIHWIRRFILFHGKSKGAGVSSRIVPSAMKLNRNLPSQVLHRHMISGIIRQHGNSENKLALREWT